MKFIGLLGSLVVDELRRVLRWLLACQVLTPGLYLSPADFADEADLSEGAGNMAALYGEALMWFGSAIRSSEASHGG